MAKKSSKKATKPKFFEADLGAVKGELEFLDTIGGFDETPRIELEIGDTRVRVLPAYSEEGRWYSKYAMHWSLPLPGEKKTFKCAQVQEEPERCLYCEGAEHYKDSNPDLYSKWRAKTRYDFNAIDLDAPDEGVKILSLPPTAAKAIFEMAEKYGDPSHPERGFNLTITKKKTGKSAMNVEYSIWPDRENSALEDWSVLDDLFNLEELFPPPSLEKQMDSLQVDNSVEEPSGLLEGVEDDVMEEAVDDESDDDVDDDEEEDEDEEEESSEAPSAADLLRARLKANSRK
jgi:hypothetical protein